MSFSVTDLARLGETAVQEFSAGMAGKGAVEKPAERLEAKLEQLYAIAATMAQKENSLEAVAVIWAGMVAVCDSMAKALSRELHGASLESYDRILDIRNACEENRALHA